MQLADEWDKWDMGHRADWAEAAGGRPSRSTGGGGQSGVGGGSGRGGGTASKGDETLNPKP